MQVFQLYLYEYGRGLLRYLGIEHILSAASRI